MDLFRSVLALIIFVVFAACIGLAGCCLPFLQAWSATQLMAFRSDLRSAVLLLDRRADEARYSTGRLPVLGARLLDAFSGTGNVAGRAARRGLGHLCRLLQR